jgi:hypothetical protein
MMRLWARAALLMLVSEVAMAQQPPPAAAPVAIEQHPSPPTPTESDHPFRRRPFAVDAVLGIATPWGLAGVSAEYAPIEHLSLSGGVGTNLIGWQFAGMARARFTPERQSSFYLGAGYSQGKHEQYAGNRDGAFSLLTGPLTSMGHNPERGHSWQTARWLNTELGVERREPRGLDVRGFLGSAFLLNADAGVAEPPDASQSALLPTREFMIYVGTALGFSM